MLSVVNNQFCWIKFSPLKSSWQFFTHPVCLRFHVTVFCCNYEFHCEFVLSGLNDRTFPAAAFCLWQSSENKIDIHITSFPFSSSWCEVRRTWWRSGVWRLLIRFYFFSLRAWLQLHGVVLGILILLYRPYIYEQNLWARPTGTYVVLPFICKYAFVRCVNWNSGFQILNICGTLVTISAYGRSVGKTEANILCAKNKLHFVMHTLLFYRLRHWGTYMKSEVLFASKINPAPLIYEPGEENKISN